MTSAVDAPHNPLFTTTTRSLRVGYVVYETESTMLCFRVLTNVFSIDVLKTVCFSCVQSVLGYGIIFCGTSSKLHEIFILHKKIIKIIKRVYKE